MSEPGAAACPSRHRVPVIDNAPRQLRKIGSCETDLGELSNRQAGILSVLQVAQGGLSRDIPRTQIKAGRWQRVHPRVYATFTGPLPRDAQIWAALLYAGDGATLSHETAAELWGLLDGQSERLHVTIPVNRRMASLAEVQIHYAHRLADSRHPTRIPRVTVVEHTVLDLIDRATRVDDVLTWVTRAVQRRRTTPERLGLALDERKKIRWRAATANALAEARLGAVSPLEIAYVRRVERAHGLPAGTRQRHRLSGPRSQWTDVEYEAFRMVVELDGRLGHVDEGAFRDRRRDNAATMRGMVTLRYGWTDTTSTPCAVAAEVTRVLQARGWTGAARPCGPACGIASAAA